MVEGDKTPSRSQALRPHALAPRFTELIGIRCGALRFWSDRRVLKNISPTQKVRRTESERKNYQ